MQDETNCGTTHNPIPSSTFAATDSVAAPLEVGDAVCQLNATNEDCP